MEQLELPLATPGVEPEHAPLTLSESVLERFEVKCTCILPCDHFDEPTGQYTVGAPWR